MLHNILYNLLPYYLQAELLRFGWLHLHLMTGKHLLFFLAQESYGTRLSSAVPSSRFTMQTRSTTKRPASRKTSSSSTTWSDAANSPKSHQQSPSSIPSSSSHTMATDPRNASNQLVEQTRGIFNQDRREGGTGGIFTLK